MLHCHIFIKACSKKDYDDFFRVGGYIENTQETGVVTSVLPVCDSDECCKHNMIFAIPLCMRKNFCACMDRLTAPLLREVIDHIDVFETEGTGKSRTQRIVVYYRFVGYVEMPEVSQRTRIKADTRKGVAVEYLTEPKTA